jgi:hypothetical protein
VERKRLVIDANILIRGCLGMRVRTLIADYADRVDFFVAEANVAEAAEKLSYCDGILFRPEKLSLVAGHGWTLQKTPDHRPGVRWSSRAREIAGAQRGTTAAGALLSMWRY